MDTDPHDLQRFVAAQSPVWDQVVIELTQGHKRSHWMWFVFPQIEGLGTSPLARKFALAGLEEARAYLDHRLLGPRLLQCTTLVNQVQGRAISAILGPPDDLKFRSCMTLFAHASPQTAVFTEALDRYFDGQQDPLTLERLN